MNVKKLQDSIQQKNQKYIPFPSSRKYSYFQEKIVKEQTNTSSANDLNSQMNDSKSKNSMNTTLNSDYDIESRKTSLNHQSSFKGTQGLARDLRSSMKQSDIISLNKGGLSESKHSAVRQSARIYDGHGSLKKINNTSFKNIDKSSLMETDTNKPVGSLTGQLITPGSSRSPQHGRTEPKLAKQEKAEILSERRDFCNSEDIKLASNAKSRIRTQELLKPDCVVSKLDFNIEADAFKRQKCPNPSKQNLQQQHPTLPYQQTSAQNPEILTDNNLPSNTTRQASKNEEYQKLPTSDKKALTEASSSEEVSNQILRQTLCSHLIDNYKLKSSNVQSVEVFSVRGGVSELKNTKLLGSVGKCDLAVSKYDLPGGKYDFPFAKTVKLEKSIITSEKSIDQSITMAPPAVFKQRAMSDKKSDISDRKNFDNSTSSFNLIKESTNLTSTSRLENSSNPNIYYSNQNQSADKNSTVQDFIYSIKDFSNGFSTYFKKKLKTFTDRLGCSCDTNLKNKETCSRAHAWLSCKYNNSEFEYLKKVYDSLKEVKPDEKSRIQIKKDINRTFPTHEFFKEKSEGAEILERVLLTFANYEPQIGYVQGMNFIAANLIYHAEEYKAFWLLVMFFDIFELRDIYLPNLPGLSKHCQIIDFLILSNLPELYQRFVINKIKVEMFCSPWIFSLFGMIIPIDEMGNFFDKMIQTGWSFFYKIIIVFLKVNKESLMSDDSTEILVALTCNNYKNLESDKLGPLDWKKIFRKANDIEIDPVFISKMLMNFDCEKLTFKIKI